MGMLNCPKHGLQPLSSACGECTQEKEYYSAKQAGSTPPFLGYERTLNWQNLPVIEKLEELLRKHYSFQKSQRPHSGGCDSLVVMPGTFTEPLTISVYYVTEVKEQDYLLGIIQNFFSKSNYPQRKVEFFEAERWHEETKGPWSSYGYLEGVLLREECYY